MNISSNIDAMHAASFSFQVSANNVANLSTADFKASEVDVTAGPGGPQVSVRKTDHSTDLIHEMTKQRRLMYDFKANAQVVRTHDEMLGNIIDILA